MRRVDQLRELRERWRTAETRPVARLLAAEMLSGRITSPSPFGAVDGRRDLRGLQVDLLGATQDPMYERLSVESGRWDDLDLTGAGLSGMNWLRLSVSNCVMDDAQLDFLRCWGVQVVDCSAQRASLASAQIGARAEGFDESSWRRVDLQGADLRGLHGNVTMEDVEVRRAKFSRTGLRWSHLTRVRFSGTVKGLSIGSLVPDERPRAWTAREVDLTGAKLEGLTLEAVDLGSPEVDIRLPDDDAQWVVRDWIAFLHRVETSAPAEIQRDVTIWVDCERRHLGRCQVWGFVSVKSAHTYGGEPFVAHLRSCR